jgi:hypothetical protein
MNSQSRILRPGWMAAAAFVLTIAASAPAGAYTPEQQQMCSNDAFRLCSSDIPDVDRVTACMISKRSQLSDGCKVFFRDTEPAPTLVTARSGKASAKSRKAAKPSKPKKKSDD